MDSAIDFAAEKALDGLLEVAKIIFSSKSEGIELKKKLLPLKDAIYEVSKKISDSDSSSDRVKLYEDFQAELNDALRLVDKLEERHRLDILHRFRYGNKLIDYRKKIKGFIHIQSSPYVVHEVQNLTGAVRNPKRRKLDDEEKVTEAIRDLERLILKDVVPRLNDNPKSNTPILQQNNTIQLSQTFNDGVDEAAATQQSHGYTFRVPDNPVGLDNPIDEVRQILLRDDVHIVGVTGMGGSGKTTLASALSNNPKVKASFHDIIFITVSQLNGNANGILDIIETMWDKIGCGPKPRFGSIEDAHNQLQENLMRRTNLRTLVILDDVWSPLNATQLVFKAKGYKTFITTRHDSTIPKTRDSRLYKMRMLEEAHGLSLFCQYAFGQSSIPTTEKENLVKQVAAECHGLPLAIKVIGSCLRDQPWPVWESAKDDLSRAEYLNDRHKEELLNCLETSVNILDDELKQCFLDLGAFPQGGKFSVDSLLDIWEYVRGMKRSYAFVVLLELASRNLLYVRDDLGRGAITYKCAAELSFSQHNVMRDLALHLASQNSERLFMPGKDDRIPTKWQTFGDQSSRAKFLSIHTGAMGEQDWCQIDFGGVEALGLFFDSSEYYLPTFLHTMRKLKVLIIYNYGSHRAILSGLPSFPSLVQIRSLLLNKLTVPPLYKSYRSLERLEKLYVCLCEGLGSITLVDNELEALNFPNITEINIDHCSDLRELPAKLCSLTSLQRLSITNCHLVPNLPADLGRLSSLKVLRLSSCPSLSRLPPSICKLRQLEYLDISLCSRLQNLPIEFNQLSMLETLDMRECSGLKNLPTFKLRSLKLLFISDNDKAIRREVWRSTNPNLTIHTVEEHFNLDWLDE